MAALSPAAQAAPADPVAVLALPASASIFRSPDAAQGLLVPGDGATVSRADVIDSLPALSRVPARATIYVALPPPGEHQNERRYPIAVRAPGYRGLLTSDATRLPGLIAIDDVAATVSALRRGEEPPLRSKPYGNPQARLAEIDMRLDDAHAVRIAANLVLAFLMVGFAAAAFATGRKTPGRAALLSAPAALATALVLSGAGISEPWLVVTLLGVGGALLALGGSLVRPALALTVAFAFLFAVLWAAPEWNALAVIGPHPESSGRFYGLTNEVETLLLAPALALGALVPLRALPFVALVLATAVGAGSIGADGGGLLVYLAGFLALALRLHRVPAARAAAATAVAAAGALALVALDAATGGSSHVSDALGGGPVELFHDFTRRLRLSAEALAKTWYAAFLAACGTAGLVWLGLRKPRFALFDAYLAAIAVSLLVNDTPNDVLGYGGLGAVALWAYLRSDETGGRLK